MSEELRKQYLVVVDDIGMAMLGRVCPMLTYVPVEGMTLNGSTTHHVLVSPIEQKNALNETPEKLISEENEPAKN